MKDAFNLRPLQPSDGPLIDRLGRESPETGRIAFNSTFRFDPYASLLALYPGVIGVVAEIPGYEGLAGMAMVQFGECTFEGAMRPFAYLFSLSVHPNFRKRGLATRLALWRVQAARERFGLEGVIYAGIQPGNTGSLRTAQRWSSQQFQGRTFGAVNKTTSKPPLSLAGVEVRPARPDEYEQIAASQNQFYQGYNFYPPQTASRLASELAEKPFGFSLNHYYVAVGQSGALLAGLSVREDGQIIPMQVGRLPPSLRIANTFIKILPEDGIIKRLAVQGFWFAAGQAQAGLHLWEATRYLMHGRGSMLMCFLDANSPLRQAVSLPRLMPSSGDGSIVLDAPVPMQPGSLIYWRN